MKNQKGFTLIELMVVVVIIGILAAIAIPRFIGAQRRARVGAAIADVTQVREALGLYEVDHGSYPASDSATTYATLKAVLVDPSTEQPYIRLPLDGKTFVFKNYTQNTDTSYTITFEVANISPPCTVIATHDSVYVP
ncbi:MAG: prepilin-type N-terminal cleavage/methylation domain-containing protein [candidate division WOR-3 bacterium]|nr:prepilin-type N-terminal cleavage/methylation domain-containing protein [candidate division WOR-3 bacterium]